MPERSPHTSFHDLPTKTVIATLSGIVTALLMAALDQNIVGTAMPKVIADLHGFEHYSGVFTAYMIASTTALPIVGKLSDFYGRKLFLLLGVAIFVIASVTCGFAQSMSQLIFFRALQGLGAGFTQAMAFTTIADLFPPAKRGKITGMMASIFGIAGVLGPALGGYLTDGPGWRYIFFVNIPIGALAFGILFFFFPHIRKPRENKPIIDYAGAVTLIMAVVPLLLALSWGGRDYPWSSNLIISLLAFGSLMFAVFLQTEFKAKEPILPLSIFKNRIVWTCLSCSAIVAIAMFGTVLFIPLFIQKVIGTNATQGGAILMPLTLSSIGSSIIAGQIITRTGRYRWLGITGVSLTAISLFVLSTMDEFTTSQIVIRNMILLGMGIGATLPTFNIAVQNAVEIHFLGAATATVQFMRSIGGSFGAAIFGSILANHYTPESSRIVLAHSLHDVFLTGSVIVLFGVIIAFLSKDIPLRRSNRQPVQKAESS